ncbi:MAG: hypothetical protein A2W90_14430 [Bacteroidetes bacterium GWF2_42_66]|nr:MAG: hypothetical protein A2W92_15825 [Bacteroidetes bacterium GWA2_42_15]OFX99108.1 MAG: hypothetical protein A2W89_06830 [Bacteroidetes bacterium GWE2_42_39]OFY46723.1 MAG: hypothetical protein A2W90_14430 [Bacteroidetes bacterium GWF2_42_66]HAZ00669.1 hypothetical protein [Marinilabiliales bacterium]HBL73871.1 hypothetical protein [Prolixibacteraceae bacterium]
MGYTPFPTCKTLRPGEKCADRFRIDDRHHNQKLIPDRATFLSGINFYFSMIYKLPDLFFEFIFRSIYPKLRDRNLGLHHTIFFRFDIKF